MHTAPIRRSAFCLALLAACCAPALAADPSTEAAEPAWFGKPDCRIAPFKPTPYYLDEISWTGECVDGYASGKGVLRWSGHGGYHSIEGTLVRGEVSGSGVRTMPHATYTGTFKGIVPHGRGTLDYRARPARYEGEIVDGNFHGKGELTGIDGARYAGEFKQGKRNGWGEQVFATGGSYTGQWKDGQFHGQGKLVYAGSGRSYEGVFENGHIAGVAAPEAGSERYVIKKTTFWTNKPDGEIHANFPAQAAWDELTPAQKNSMRSQYQALETGDDPPFPAQGQQAMFDAVHRINKSFGLVQGRLLVHVVVGTDGKPLRVNAYSQLKQEFVDAISNFFMSEKYKPARCQGQACQMVYQVNFDFKLD